MYSHEESEVVAQHPVVTVAESPQSGRQLMVQHIPSLHNPPTDQCVGGRDRGEREENCVCRLVSGEGRGEGRRVGEGEEKCVGR